MSQIPSIFNDVIGPVMRGPSSSHCAASLRIGRICRDLMEGDLPEVLIEFDTNGSLETTHDSQGSDMGLFGGFLGWEAHDERLVGYKKGIKEAGIDIQIKIVDEGWEHPNTYKITLTNQGGSHQLIAISEGGGMIEIVEIDRAPISMVGDYHETLIYLTEDSVDADAIMNIVKDNFDHDFITLCDGAETFIQVKAQKFFEEALYNQLLNRTDVKCLRQINPVLPVGSRKDLKVPFITCDEMLEYNKDKDLSLWELAVHFESARAGISHGDVVAKMTDIVRIMTQSIESGLKGTEFGDRILGAQSLNFKKQLEKKSLVESSALNKILMYVSAMMEVKSSMGVIVAAPTAGSCGALPGAVIGAGHAMELSEEEIVKGMLSAGIIGLFIAAGPGFAAEVGGCQAECGSGSGMAAAGIVTMAGGHLNQCLGAASMALQNSLGMVCDPIANRVEAPCLGRNTMAATNALSCSNMALSSYDHLIPLDEVIAVMDEVGQRMHRSLRCTALGGLSMTKTSKEIEAKLAEGLGEDAKEKLKLASKSFKIC